ncbi:hypothetical protein B0T16DRAFT_17428 [Cercophora newfieldiana]|uniref:Uncharacterized protein n=1 Tax=Cercophora newfieldiana TaxID=92897 RepID=A0AA39YND0_9PEZI|nr:hypothetical protein B0T16DRAFT_17428 [Cercophora newfieldiana]
MYGSESQRSASSSISPPFDDMAQRSYSMTSCSSRYQKPTQALQDHVNQSSLQRPRSPFPYPTRLKRPGVRPSSPALTDNGVDYSRMVGIDRVSYRTVHGSYRPTYPSHGRRPTPKLPRLRANSPGMSYLRYDGVSGSQISRAMSSSVPPGWRNRYNGRSASEQSLRSSSLTSIVDMYRPPSCTPSVQSLPLRPQAYGAFYYDYSEDFDNQDPPAIPPAPLAPIPTRLPSFRRATVLNDGYDAGFQASTNYDFVPLQGRDRDGSRGDGDETVSSPLYLIGLDDVEPKEHHNPPGSERNNQDSRSDATKDVELLTKQPEIRAAQSNDCNGETLVRLKGAGSLESTPLGGEAGMSDIAAIKALDGYPASGEACGQTPLPRNSELTSSKTCAKYTPKLPTLASPKCTTTYHIHSTPESRTRSVSPSSVSSKRGTKVYSIEPGLSDLASLVQNLDKATDYVDEDESSIFSRINLPIGMWRADHKLLDRDQSDGREDVEHDIANFDEDGFIADFRGHKRNLAMPTIGAGQLPLTDDSVPTQAVHQPAAVSGSLEPRPTINRLRPQCSAPQLMKALPPLPNGSVRSESYVANLSVDDLDLPSRFPPLDISRITTPRSMLSEVSSLDIPRSRQNGDFGTLISSKDGGRIGNLAKAMSLGINSSYRMGAYPVSREGCSSFAHTFGEERKSSRPGNNKLRLRVSRGAMAKVQSELKHHSSHITLRPAVVGLQSSSELPVLPPLEIYLDGPLVGNNETGKCDRGPVHRQAESASNSDPTPGTSLVMLSSRIEEQDELGKAPEEAQTLTLRATSTPSADARSSCSDRGSAGGKPAHGLRKRISDLRVRVAEARIRSVETPSPTNFQEGEKATSPPHAIEVETREDEMVGGPGEEMSEVDSPSVPLRGFRGRMSRWMRAARHAAMVACAGSRKRG